MEKEAKAEFVSERPGRKVKATRKQRLLSGAGLPLWVAAGFVLASMLASLIISLLYQVGLLNVTGDNPVFLSVVAALIYVLALLLVVGLPLKLRGDRTTKEELGIKRLPTWLDIVFAPAGFIVYMLLAGILLAAITALIPGFNPDEAQDVGFENLNKYYEYILAFTTLVIVAPIAEEVLVRGYLYGKLRKVLSAFSTILITAILFALLHLGIGSTEQGGFTVTQWNVALNILPLGIVLAVLRETTGSIWAGVLLHMLKNGVAFYFLFVNPSFLNTIGG